MVCVLMPAVMLLMGERTWWLPRCLDRILPHLDVEGGSAHVEEPVDATDEEPALA